MSRWNEVSLRPHGQPWPGLKTRTGRIAKIGGEMNSAINVIINTEDVLAKRKGFVRAFDEQFSGPICGLFKYTDFCGVERLLVADESGFSIRTPFTVPVFTIADCYPFDAFSLSDLSDLDEDNWRNTARYTHRSDRMALASTAASEAGIADLPALAARWFKDSCGSSYQVRVTYSFDSTAAASSQRCFVVIRGNGALQEGAMLLAVLTFKSGTTYESALYQIDSLGNLNLIGKGAISGLGTGTMTLAYNGTTRVATLTVDPTTASPVTVTSSQFTTLQDANLGLVSAIGLADLGDGSTPNQQSFGIDVVDGGNV